MCTFAGVSFKLQYIAKTQQENKWAHRAAHSLKINNFVSSRSVFLKRIRGRNPLYLEWRPRWPALDAISSMIATICNGRIDEAVRFGDLVQAQIAVYRRNLKWLNSPAMPSVEATLKLWSFWFQLRLHSGNAQIPIAMSRTCQAVASLTSLSARRLDDFRLPHPGVRIPRVGFHSIHHHIRIT